MKAVIFAGGVGTRLWPLSRKRSPKQFEKIIGEKSTLQLTVERLYPDFKPEDTYISTGEAYVEIIAKQLDYIPKKNIIAEPEKKDVGPAVALVMSHLTHQGFANEPVVILWSDHLVRNKKKFKEILLASESLITKEKNRIVFIGQKPRFASENLGWIEYNAEQKKEGTILFHEFIGFKYRPNKKLADQYLVDKQHCWNLGYFVTTPQFILDLFKRFSPQIFDLVQKILKSQSTNKFQQNLKNYYKKMPVINFDNAILEQLDPKRAYVVVEDIGWSDIGAWESLKEALNKKQDENITHGNVHLKDSVDNLVYNYGKEKLIVGVDLEDLLIVNTDDVLLVSKKSSSAKVKKIVEEFDETDKNHLT